MEILYYVVWSEVVSVCAVGTHNFTWVDFVLLGVPIET